MNRRLSFSHHFSLLFFMLFTNPLEPSPLYDNHHYHEECLRCNSCAINLTGVNQKRARRFKNQILCDLHFAGNDGKMRIFPEWIPFSNNRNPTFLPQTWRSWNVLTLCSNYAVLNLNLWDPSSLVGRAPQLWSFHCRRKHVQVRKKSK